MGSQGKAAAENYLHILKRNEITVNSHAIPEVQYYTDKANYLGALAALQPDIAQLEQARTPLDVCTYGAQYDMDM